MPFYARNWYEQPYFFVIDDVSPRLYIHRIVEGRSFDGRGKVFAIAVAGTRAAYPFLNPL
jgi:hypothetical protein